MYADQTLVDHVINKYYDVVYDLDRSLYIDYCKSIEKYCADNHKEIIVGGQNGVDMILKNKPSTVSFSWVLLTPKVFYHAKELLKCLYKTKTTNIYMREWNKTMKLTTSIPHKEVTIVINNRYFCTIYEFKKIYKLFSDGLFLSIKVPVVEEDLFLIDVYQKLYTPYNETTTYTYTDILHTENLIYEQLFKDNKIYKDVLGGAQNIQKDYKKFTIPQILFYDILSYLASTDTILIGEFAINSYNINVSKNIPDRIQIISNDDISNINLILTNLLKHYNLQIVIKKMETSIVTDFRLTKHIVYAVDSHTNNQQPIMDIFNSTSYEIIPYSTIQLSIADKQIPNIKIGNPFVLIRFKFIDLWNMKLVYHFSNNKKYIYILKSIILNIKIIKKYINNLIPDYDKLFQTTDYIGNYKSEKSAKKLIRKQYPYLPAIYANRLVEN